ncbi:MAG: tRNA pseudouridine(55) synthase TruB [Candidatus Omnitrophica bacterium]|nr:tRNA pseudouridine(55) synthase TruB [Candidatus Omnitrophota bacterium]
MMNSEATKKETSMQGIIVVNKSQGMTSHDVVMKMRRKFKIQRVGHAGTLDPLATGVLVVLFGKATKLFSKFVSFDKAYRATLKLGTTTDSADTEGKILKESSYDHITLEDLEAAMKKFSGPIKQIPPMVSAIKHKGKKLYQLARKGISVERKPRDVVIYDLHIVDFSPPHVKFYLECSKGTYVRQIADDIGTELGCGACITQIERIKVGPFQIEDAHQIEGINESYLRNWEG